MNASTRKVIYYAAMGLAVVAAVAVVAGFVTQEAVERVLTLAPAFFASVAAILALVNITPDDN